jgi:D-arabinose 1-dehydrogenase-like Zn-dependent alcohol dehydrogenase
LRKIGLLFSEKIIVPQNFVLLIPDGLDLQGAAPLLCADITTWSTLRHWAVREVKTLNKQLYKTIKF